jgi:hypothetical protein
MITELLDATKTNDLIHLQAIALTGRSHNLIPGKGKK